MGNVRCNQSITIKLSCEFIHHLTTQHQSQLSSINLNLPIKTELYKSYYNSASIPVELNQSQSTNKNRAPINLIRVQKSSTNHNRAQLLHPSQMELNKSEWSSINQNGALHNRAELNCFLNHKWSSLK